MDLRVFCVFFPWPEQLIVGKVPGAQVLLAQLLEAAQEETRVGATQKLDRFELGQVMFWEILWSEFSGGFETYDLLFS